MDNKKLKIYSEPDVYNTPESITAHEKQVIDWMKSVEKTILAGRVYATVSSVSASGMSRRIKFYRALNDKQHTIENITAPVAWLTTWVQPGQFKSRDKWLIDSGLYVGGCGMDMIFHTLYTALKYEQASKWNQRYSTL